MSEKFITAAECVIIKEALEKYKKGFVEDGVIAEYCDSLIRVFQAYADDGGIEGATDTVTVTDVDAFADKLAQRVRDLFVQAEPVENEWDEVGSMTEADYEDFLRNMLGIEIGDGPRVRGTDEAGEPSFYGTSDEDGDIAQCTPFELVQHVLGDKAMDAAELRNIAAEALKMAAQLDANTVRIRIDETAGDINGNVITAEVENVLSLRELGRPYGAAGA